jgi:hypothetical protein
MVRIHRLTLTPMNEIERLLFSVMEYNYRVCSLIIDLCLVLSIENSCRIDNQNLDVLMHHKRRSFSVGNWQCLNKYIFHD